MKPTLIAFEQLFPTGVYANQRLRAEIQLDDTGNPQEAFALAKKIVNDAFERLNQQIQWWHETGDLVVDEKTKMVITQTNNLATNPKEDATQRMIRAINECSTISVLETFKLLASKNPIIQEAYDNKLKSLQ